MQGFEIKPDVYQIGAKSSGEFNLNKGGYVCGVSIENDADSPNDLQFSLNGSPWIKCRAGDRARSFGGFDSCSVPGHFTGILKWKFDTANAGTNLGLVIITRITTATKEIQ